MCEGEGARAWLGGSLAGLVTKACGKLNSGISPLQMSLVCSFESLLVFICSLLSCLLVVKHVPFAHVSVFDLHILWALLDEYRLVYLCCNTHMCASSTYL